MGSSKGQDIKSLCLRSLWTCKEYTSGLARHLNIWYPPSMPPEHTLRLLCSENGVTSCALLCHQALPRPLELTKLLFSLLFQHKMGQQLLNSLPLQRRKSGPTPCPPGCFPFQGKRIWREVCTFPQIVVYCLSLWFKSLFLAVTSAIDWPIMQLCLFHTPWDRFDIRWEVTDCYCFIFLFREGKEN